VPEISKDRRQAGPANSAAVAASAAMVTCTVCELHAEAVFRVEGMDCSEEVVILERRLRPISGVEAISADLIGQRLHVKYDAAKLTTSTLVDAIGDTGMRMWLEHEEPLASQGAATWRARLVVTSGVALAAGLLLAWRGQEVAAAILCLVSAVTGGIYPARRAISAVRSRTIDINVLMVIAVAGAIALGDWAEAASVVFLFAIAQWLEVRTMERARQAIRALIDLAPQEALVKRHGHEHRVRVDEIRVGEEIVIRPGDKVPLDGEVVAGHSDVNEAPITGESLPVDKSPGHEVYAGTINGRGALEVRITRLRRDTRLARIIHLVEAAQAQRAPVQTFVDRFARIYTPAVIAIAIVVAVAPPLLGATTEIAALQGSASEWLYRALVLLVIACPCALVISTPVSIVAALAGAARHGVLIKGGAYLERLASVKAIAFDKTGTLTRGEPQVVEVIPLDGASPRDVLERAAALEARSHHPIARAILKRAAEAGIRPAPASNVVALHGLGAEGAIDGHAALVGSERLFEERELTTAAAGALLAPQRRAGRTLVLVAFDRRTIGALAIADRSRESAKEAIELLREHGVKHVAMLTGDHADTARAVASELGLDEHRAALLPEQKHTAVRQLRAAYGPVLMVGDGVNDAPALAAADVGIAMGAAASDAALETADVALMSDELLKLPYALRLARATLRNIKTNVAISLVLKAAFLVMAVAGVATLWMAILADTGASVIVVANALRLLRAK
jgi:Cd2+/Zn2+-exporting ATPase